MYLSGLIFFSLQYITIHEGLIKLNSVFVPRDRAIVKLCQISKNYEYVHNKIRNTAIQDACSCQILTDLKGYRNVFVRIAKYICKIPYL